MTEYTSIILIVASVGSGLVAGVFFAFSTFIMRALQQIPKAPGIAAMKRINVTVLNPLFFLAFFGTGIVCLLIVYLVLTGEIEKNSGLLLAGSGAYVVFCLLSTIVFNVPLNNRLEAMSAESAEAESFWAFYNRRWLFWNHVRTVASLVAAVLFALAL